jgi:hypothetical protein
VPLAYMNRLTTHHCWPKVNSTLMKLDPNMGKAVSFQEKPKLIFETPKVIVTVSI